MLELALKISTSWLISFRRSFQQSTLRLAHYSLICKSMEGPGI
jgi:hypothetical protein